MKNSFIFLLLFVLVISVSAQPSIVRQSVFGEPALDDQAESIIEMPAGGYAVAGYSGNPLNYNYLITRLTDDFSVVWQTNLGGIDVDKAYGLAATEDGGVVVTGISLSPDGDVGQNNGGVDTWVVRLSNEGDTVWTKVLGGTGEDFFRSIITLPDGSFILTGHSNSANGDFPENYGILDLWVVKLSSDGEVVWKYNYGGSGNDSGSDVVYDEVRQQLLVIGSSSSSDGNVSLNKGGRDVWLLHLDMEGNLLWEKTYGGTLGDFGIALTLTTNGGVAFISDIISNDGDITQSFGQGDIWMARVDSAGNLLWQRTIGLSALDNGRDIIYDAISDYVYGVGINYDPTVSPPNYIWDVNFIKLNGLNGGVVWTQNFGGSLYDFGNGMTRNSLGNYVIAGYTDSTDGDLGGGYKKQEVLHGNHDIWVFELDEYVANTDLDLEIASGNDALAFIPALQSVQVKTLLLHPAKLVFTDLTGRIVYAEYLHPTTDKLLIGLPDHLPSGIYFATLSDEISQICTVKIILP